MIYVIKGKPYIKVSTYYKEVKVEMKGKEVSITPIGGHETRLVRPNPRDVIEMNPIAFLSNKDKRQRDNLNKDKEENIPLY